MVIFIWASYTMDLVKLRRGVMSKDDSWMKLVKPRLEEASRRHYRAFFPQ